MRQQTRNGGRLTRLRRSFGCAAGGRFETLTRSVGAMVGPDGVRGVAGTPDGLTGILSHVRNGQMNDGRTIRLRHVITRLTAVARTLSIWVCSLRPVRVGTDVTTDVQVRVCGRDLGVWRVK